MMPWLTGPVQTGEQLSETYRKQNIKLNARVTRLQKQRNVYFEALAQIKKLIETEAPDDVNPDDWSWGCWTLASNALNQIYQEDE